MVITEKDQKSFISKYGYMNAHHIEGDKALEERISAIDDESEYMLKGMKEMGVKEDNHLYQGLKESYTRMKEDIKKFYK